MVNMSVMAAPDGVGVEAVGEVVAKHGDRHHGPDGAAGLEPGTDGHAVQQAVHDQRGRGEQAEAWGVKVARVLTLLTFVPAVDRQRALDDVQGQKAENRGEHGQWNAEQLAGLLAECFGHQVEADDTEHEPCREPEDEVLLVAEPQGREATDQCGDECSKRHKNGDRRHLFSVGCVPGRNYGGTRSGALGLVSVGSAARSGTADPRSLGRRR
jgi:hypothetical protein